MNCALSSAVLALISDSGSDLLPEPDDDASESLALCFLLSNLLSIEWSRYSPSDCSFDISLSISTTVVVSLRTASMGTLLAGTGAVWRRSTLWRAPSTSSRDFLTDSRWPLSCFEDSVLRSVTVEAGYDGSGDGFRPTWNGDDDDTDAGGATGVTAPGVSRSTSTDDSPASEAGRDALDLDLNMANFLRSEPASAPPVSSGIFSVVFIRLYTIYADDHSLAPQRKGWVGTC